MRLRYVWLFCVANMVAGAMYFMNYWNAQKELYWAIIALLNTKTALVLMISQVISLYSAIIMSIHRFVFTQTREGERFVIVVNQGHCVQGQIQIADLGYYSRLSVYVIRLLDGDHDGVLHDCLDFHVVF